MAVTKKTVGTTKAPKPSPKARTTKVAATKIIPTRMHSTEVI